MKIHRSTGYIHIDLTGPEATVLLEELENVRGGSKLYKMRQVCDGLRNSLALSPPKSEGAPLHDAAVALGSLGGLKGGKARAAALSSRERSEAAKKAAEARWGTGDIKPDEEPPCDD